MLTTDDALTSLSRINQSHLLRFESGLSDAQRASLLAQIGSFDLPAIPALVERYVTAKSDCSIDESTLAPASYYPHDAALPVRPWDRERFRDIGIDLIAGGKVAAFTVAGGQGSRLGYDGPKGCFPANPISGKPLFEVFAEWVRAAQTKWCTGKPLYWYIMTSPLNHDATTAFFCQHNHFGLDVEQVMFFQQGTLPSFDKDSGRILMADKHTVATNPDGHGGSLNALHKSGALDHMQERGVEHISYVQVDNPLARVFDPVFVGLHARAEDSSAQMSSKMVAKSDPAEKVGIFASAGGKTQVIEYSDLPSHLSEQRDADGSLAYCGGSIAIHVIAVEFVRKIASDPAFALPLHRAEKKVACIDPDSGALINPASPNAVKLEAFVFDALSMCDSSIVYETSRTDEFAPIKNAEGSDSPASSAQLQTRRVGAWLDAIGVTLPRKPDGSPDCEIELSPLTAIEAEDLRTATLPEAIEPGARLSI